ncbi:hypothetical protein [Lutibaculum baratangense]|uniref:Uncharacterized protein n=1 Tax=Lutibaculum baratangense AMV1 TaxID=631454 RepID=V4RN96_9HYPH|nr:hypothetical protein [Lutibaculum baratangense]ESR26759.1 hypothetical protein N177_0543 [Lutibaculum baratangense AMV1]
MANASHKTMGHGQGGPKGHQHVGSENPDEAFDQDDLQDEIKGRNSLQGNDQLNVHDQRQAQPHMTTKTEGVVESFEKQDPKKRTGK